MFIVIIIVIICHELGLNRPVLTSSNGLFKGLSSHLQLYGLYFSITFQILLLYSVIAHNIYKNE
jgi:hypothetical protein